MPKAPKAKKKPAGKVAGSYVHQTDTVPMRPEIGTQANFRKKKAPKTYRYDSSLSPALEWDRAAGREVGEWLLSVIERAAALPPPKPVAFVFGPENGAISEKLVHSALKEAQLKSYTHLYVIGFAIQPHAREFIEKSSEMGLVPATYVQATPDLMMGDRLKNRRSSQIFSVCGLPEIKVARVNSKLPTSNSKEKKELFEVELIGLDTFDPTTMDTDHRPGNDVPCWMLDGVTTASASGHRRCFSRALPRGATEGAQG